MQSSLRDVRVGLPGVRAESAPERLWCAGPDTVAAAGRQARRRRCRVDAVSPPQPRVAQGAAWRRRTGPGLQPRWRVIVCYIVLCHAPVQVRHHSVGCVAESSHTIAPDSCLNEPRQERPRPKSSLCRLFGRHCARCIGAARRSQSCWP